MEIMAGVWVREMGFGMRDMGYRIQDTGYGRMDGRQGIKDNESCSIFTILIQPLASGFLAFGSRILTPDLRLASIHQRYL